MYNRTILRFKIVHIINALDSVKTDFALHIEDLVETELKSYNEQPRLGLHREPRILTVENCTLLCHEISVRV